jgi:transposase
VPGHRAEWLGKITEAGVRRRGEFYYQQTRCVDVVTPGSAARSVSREQETQSVETALPDPVDRPIRAALLIAILQTPHRFRTKRQLQTYSGFGIETHSSADHRYVEGQLQRSKKPVSLRGLNRNCIHDLKNLFKVRQPLPPANRAPSSSLTRLWWPKE